MPTVNEHDLTGLKCPMPIVRLNLIIKELAHGEECVISADDPAFGPDVEAWCRTTKNELVSCRKDGRIITAIIRKKT